MLKDNISASAQQAGNGVDTSVHFSLQGKGGVGKSFVASLLSQYFIEKNGERVFCIDSDPINATFSGYEELKVDHLDVMRRGQVHERQFDALIERICRNEGIFVVDTGATNFIPLWHYILENEIVRLLGDNGRKAFVHVVIVGGQV
jgi:cellulose biosynthesis protein BcsQ